MKLNWVPHEMKAECYFDDEEAIQIFIIKTGFEGLYLIAFDDAENAYVGDTELMSKAQIKEKYGIDIQI